MAVTAVTVESILTRINNHFKDDQNTIYSEAVKIGWINEAQKDLAWKLPIDALSMLVVSRKQDSVESTTGSYKYPLPDDFMRMIEVVYYNIPCKPILLRQRQIISRNMDYCPTESEPMAIIRERKIEIYPSSLSAGTNKIELIYLKIPDTLSAKGDTVVLDQFEELILFYSLSQGYAIDRQPEADSYKAQYINGIVELLGVK